MPVAALEPLTTGASAGLTMALRSQTRLDVGACEVPVAATNMSFDMPSGALTIDPRAAATTAALI